MDIVTRAKNICVTPNTEWPVIASEPTTTAALLSGYVVPLAAAAAVAGLIGASLVGIPFVRTPAVAWGVMSACFTFVAAIVGVFALAVLINALAPTFGAAPDSRQALKVAVYSYTPYLVLSILRIVPLLGLLAVLGALYGFYLLYLGLQSVMKCPPETAVAYTAVVVVLAIVVGMVVNGVETVVAAVVGSGLMSRG